MGWAGWGFRRDADPNEGGRDGTGCRGGVGGSYRVITSFSVVFTDVIPAGASVVAALLVRGVLAEGQAHRGCEDEGFEHVEALLGKDGGGGGLVGGWWGRLWSVAVNER